jgi:branched-chain amino acid aminotransferase
MSDWLNGTWTDGAARVDAADRGFLLGDGLFETICVRDGRVWRVMRHLARLADGAAQLGIPLPVGIEALAAVIREAAPRNGVAAGMVRVTLTRGMAAGGLVPAGAPAPTLLVTARARAVDDGPLRATISRSTRRNEFSPSARIKTTSYVDGIAAAREAAATGSDTALLLNTQGRLAEGAVANLFCVIDGCAVTPPVSEGALPGIMRAEVMARTGAVEMALEEGALASAEEALLTNSAGVRALIAVDGRSIGDGRPGPLTARLQSQIWQHEEDADG